MHKTVVLKTNISCTNNRGGVCLVCGKPFEYEQMELHHILPIARFPELGKTLLNGCMLCNRCHKEIHCNPFKNIEMMQRKADELGIDLKERYGLNLTKNEVTDE